MTLKYTRLTRGLSDAQMVPSDKVYDYITNDQLDWYTSLYTYNKTHYEQFKTTHSVKGIRDVTSNKLWWDFDSKENPDKARKDTLELVSRIENLGIPSSDIEIYYSGNKGYNVLLTQDKELSRPAIEEFCLNKMGKGLETLDTTMYDENQILRVPGTRHQVSKLYKIPITKEQLNLPTEAIRRVAADINNVKATFAWNAVSINDSMFAVEEKKASPVSIMPDFDITKVPTGWKPYKWSLAEGHFESGERHQALMVVAATCRGLGYDKDTAYYICKAALKKQATRSGNDEFPKEELYNNIIDSVYSDGWQGGQYSFKTNPWLKAYAERMDLVPKEDEDVSVCQIVDIETGFKNYVEHIEENTIKTGIPELDKAMPLTIGMNLGIVGAASSGKTALALEILKNTSKAGVISVFASLDMHRNRLFEKLIYKATGFPRDKIYQMFKDGRGSEVTKSIKEDYKNVWFYDRSCPSVQDIKTYIKKVEDTTGKKVKLLMVDYFERVNSDKSEDTAASKDVAGSLQDLINDMDICVVTLVQPNKFSLSGGPDAPILSYTAIKGSSFLYQSFRSIISIWRPFFTPELKDHDKYMQMAILKNDLGEIGMFNFGWVSKTGDIYRLTEEEEETLQALLDEKKQDKSDGDWG